MNNYPFQWIIFLLVLLCGLWAILATSLECCATEIIFRPGTVSFPLFSHFILFHITLVESIFFPHHHTLDIASYHQHHSLCPQRRSDSQNISKTSSKDPGSFQAPNDGTHHFGISTCFRWPVLAWLSASFRSFMLCIGRNGGWLMANNVHAISAFSSLWFSEIRMQWIRSSFSFPGKTNTDNDTFKLSKAFLYILIFKFHWTRIIDRNSFLDAFWIEILLITLKKNN